MDNEVTPPVLLTSSASSDSSPRASVLKSSSIRSTEKMSSFQPNNGVVDSVSFKVPSSVPYGVDIRTSSYHDDKNQGTSSVGSLQQQSSSAGGERKIEQGPSLGVLRKKSHCGVKNNEQDLSSSSSNDGDFSDFLSGRGFKWTEKISSRIGKEYQASHLPDAGSYLTFQEDDFDQLEQLLLADQIWDPIRATIEGTNDYVHEKCPSNRKEAALEYLHQRDYDETLISMEEINKLSVLDGSDWTLNDHVHFRRLMQSERHNVNTVAKSMGKSINNCLTVYYKIINVRETRSTTKNFSGIKPMEEMNELKDIGRSMRIEERNRQKHSSTNVKRKVTTSDSIVRKRRKASSPSDKIKKHNVNKHQNQQNSTSNKSRYTGVQMGREQESLIREGIHGEISPYKSNNSPVKAQQIILTAASSMTDLEQGSNKSDEDNHDFPGNFGTRAAKAKALFSLCGKTTLGGQENKEKSSIGTRITRTMTKAKCSTHQNKRKKNNKDDSKNKVMIETKVASTNQSDNFSSWEARYQALIEFKNKTGHCLVPKVYPENRHLSYWVFRQRSLYSSKLQKNGENSLESDERFQKLKDIGFIFRAKHSKEQDLVDSARRQPQLDARWNTFFEEFCEFKKKTGSCLIPKVFEENQPLSCWAFAQRNQMKRRKDGKHTLLTEERIKKLNEIGFIWQAKKNKEWREADRQRKQAMVESMWQKHYNSLLAFKKKHGHTRVPKNFKENQPLSTWVFRQRAHYRRRNEGDDHALNDNRLNMLEKIGFQFRVRK